MENKKINISLDFETAKLVSDSLYRVGSCSDDGIVKDKLLKTSERITNKLHKISNPPSEKK